jgi:branched-chain amino acid aminotransferase
MSEMLSFDDRDGLIWLDSALVPWHGALLHVMTHALHVGGAVFEGIRAYDGRRVWPRHIFQNAVRQKGPA